MSRARDRTATDTPSYERRAADAHLTPLWTFFKDWFASEPRSRAAAHLWHYDGLRPLLMDAAAAISTAEAERRVLALENPGMPGQHLATDSLYAGLQLIMPGEFARAHRHTAAALRFIVEGAGAYTAVAGERCYMEPGDFIVTPAWAWHEHRNEGTAPTVWLDVLDVPLVRFLSTGFSEHYAELEHPRQPPPDDSRNRFGRGLKPVGFARSSGNTWPVFSYPFAAAYEALDRLRRTDDWDDCHGLRMEYVDPTSGSPAIPTISTFLQLLTRGFATRPYMTTSGTIFTAISGRGRVTIGRDASAVCLDFGPRDLWAVPSWQPMTIEATEETVLFSASDEAVQRKLGLWRERRGL